LAPGFSCFRRFREINEESVDANPTGFRIPGPIIVAHFPELTANPFADRLCTVFSSRRG
jgi:hypothetical protein